MNELTIGDISEDNGNYTYDMNENVTVVVEAFPHDTSRHLMTTSRNYTQERSVILNTYEDVTARTKLSYANLDSTFQNLVESTRTRYKDDLKSRKGDDEEPEILVTSPQGSQSFHDSQILQDSQDYPELPANSYLDALIYEDFEPINWSTRLRKESERKLWQEFFFAWSVFGLNIFLFFTIKDPREHIQMIIYYLIASKTLFLLKNSLIFKKEDIRDKNQRRKLFAITEDICIIFFFIITQLKLADISILLIIGSAPGMVNSILMTILTDLRKDKINLLKKYLFWLIFILTSIKVDHYTDLKWRIALIPAFLFLTIIGGVGLIALKYAITWKANANNPNNPNAQIESPHRYGYCWLFLIGLYGLIWFWITFSFATFFDCNCDSAKTAILSSLIGGSVHSVILLSYTYLLKHKLVDWLQRAFAEYSPENLNSEEAVAPIRQENKEDFVLIPELGENTKYPYLIMISPGYFVTYRKKLETPQQIEALRQDIMKAKREYALKGKDVYRKLKTSNPARTIFHELEAEKGRGSIRNQGSIRSSHKSPLKVNSPLRVSRNNLSDSDLEKKGHRDSLQRQISSSSFARGILPESDHENIYKESLKRQISITIPLSNPNDSAFEEKKDGIRLPESSISINININSHLNDSGADIKRTDSLKRQAPPVGRLSNNTIDNDNLHKNTLQRQLSNNIVRALINTPDQKANRPSSYLRRGSFSTNRLSVSRQELSPEKKVHLKYVSPIVPARDPNKLLKYSYSDADGKAFQNIQKLRRAPSISSGGTFGDKACVLCYVNPPSCVFIPCGHGGHCFDCASKVLKQNKKCFICRREVEKLLQIDENLIYDDLAKVLKIFAINSSQSGC